MYFSSINDSVIEQGLHMVQNGSPANHTKQSITNHRDPAEDATWILTSSFIIFTMQSGFGLLETGMVSSKNECNIMVKNAVDVIFGAFSYWLFGFGLSFGDGPQSNGFTGVGNFLVNADEHHMGPIYSKYFFQLSFATTATTIVSGAMAERTNLVAYMAYSFTNTFTYVFPAHWMWDTKGFLAKMGAIDIAGCGPVHLVGGAAAVVATLLLKPRHKRFDKDYRRDMASPTNIVLGTFMLWWGWLGFNCGSTFGVSGAKWKLATKAAVITINGSIGGALFAIVYSYRLNKKYKGKLDVPIFMSGILGGLVGITAICTICKPWEALLIGFVGGIITCVGIDALEWIGVDDPVGCIPTHGFAGIWGLIVVGLFAERDTLENTNSQSGLFKGGSVKFLGVQVLACVSIIGWAMFSTFIQLFVTDKIFGLRISLEEEILGADFCEHGIEPRDEEGHQSGHAYGRKRNSLKRGNTTEHSSENQDDVDCQIDGKEAYINRACRFPPEEIKESSVSNGTSNGSVKGELHSFKTAFSSTQNDKHAQIRDLSYTETINS